MTTAVISLSNNGARIATRLARELTDCDRYMHSSVSVRCTGRRFEAVIPLTHEIFHAYKGLIYIMPCGVVVRALDGLPRHKTKDPAIIVIDTGARHVISLLSGHEGGANDLALAAANILGAEPVITTTTEADKDIIVGIGCRRGTPEETILAAIRDGLKQARVSIKKVRWLASADLKHDETGLLAAAHNLGIGLRLIPSSEIRATSRTFGRSSFVQAKVNLPAVAEPAALLAGRRTALLLPKTILHGVTIAVAKENSI